MPSTVILGNDVVDLTDPRCPGKASDRRFLRRVFTEPEAAAIRESPTPDLTLWQYWAAKEAAFKAVSRLLPSPPPFEHARFQVALGGLLAAGYVFRVLRETVAQDPGGQPAAAAIAVPFPLVGFLLASTAVLLGLIGIWPLELLQRGGVP